MMKNKDNAVNLVATKLQMLHVLFEPVILARLIYAYNGHVATKSLIAVWIYTLYTSRYIYKKLLKPDLTQISHSDDGKHQLIWNWNNRQDAFVMNALFISSFTLLGYENLGYPDNVMFTSFLLSSLSFSLLFKKEIGRYWFKIVAFAPLMFLFSGSSFTW